MECKLIERESEKVVGMVYRGRNEQGEIPKMWQVFNARSCEIKSQSNACYGLCYDYRDDGSFAYMAGMAVSEMNELPDGMEVAVVPAGKYAVFTFKDHISKIGEFWDAIYKDYLPENHLTPKNSMTFEWYDERFQVNGECDIYIPIF